MDVEVSASTLESDLGIGCGFFSPLASKLCILITVLLSLITEIHSFICSCTLYPGAFQSIAPQKDFHSSVQVPAPLSSPNKGVILS